MEFPGFDKCHYSERVKEALTKPDANERRITELEKVQGTESERTRMIFQILKEIKQGQETNPAPIPQIMSVPL